MDVSAVQALNPSMTVEQYLDLLFSLQQEHLSQHIRAKLEVRSA
jgi:hypothetical protein